MQVLNKYKFIAFAIIAMVFVISSSNKIMAQEKTQMVRIAKIKVDPLQLEKYNTALKEQMTTAVKLEPGVITYYAVSDQKDPSVITILEIYASKEAYNTHIETAHFKKYKETVKDMVKSLELVDVDLLGFATKPN
ncbi:putative quinol monooxygenase [Pedobacter namyangjuensis]|uniref:putative quinol monooxygenase n=1 Tax=Pedobacter namyangjuensis TaxID=600626 RepID=UPI0019629C2C|nr:putative quinol monooxygenase [Pedobacter namyangjuensis]